MEQELAFLPQPYRLLSLVQLALLTSAVSLRCLSSSVHPPLWYASLSLGVLLGMGLVATPLLRAALGSALLLPASNPAAFLTALPASILLLVPYRLAPFAAHFRSAHRRLHVAFARILFQFPLAEHHPTSLPDIIIADLLTSLARPFADFALRLAVILHLPPRLQSFLFIISNSLPYLLRFRQCMNDLVVVPHSKLRSAMNALKYSTAIPMIILQWRVTHSSANPQDDGGDNATIKAWWIAACLINSLYSTWWDVVKDWGISSQRVLEWYHHQQQRRRHHYHHHHHHHHHHHSHHHHHAAARKPDLEAAPLVASNTSTSRVLFGGDQWWVYVVLILLNAGLRQTWLATLVAAGHQPSVWAAFLLQTLEVLRRALWLLLRLESADLGPRAPAGGYALLGLADPDPDPDPDAPPLVAASSTSTTTSCATSPKASLPLLPSHTLDHSLVVDPKSSPEPKRAAIKLDIIRDRLASPDPPDHLLPPSHPHLTFLLNRSTPPPPPPLIPLPSPPSPASPSTLQLPP